MNALQQINCRMEPWPVQLAKTNSRAQVVRSLQDTTMPISPSELPEGSSWGALAAGAVASVLYLRRFLSRQGVDIKKDTAEANLISTLQVERDKAMAAAEKAWTSRTDDAKLIGELTSEVRASREIIDQLKDQLVAMAEEMKTLRLIIDRRHPT